MAVVTSERKTRYDASLESGLGNEDHALSGRYGVWLQGKPRNERETRH
jgi:hypothetical protein